MNPKNIHPEHFMRNAFLFLALSLILACGGGGGGSSPSVNDTPSLSNLSLSPGQVTVNYGGGSAIVELSVDFQAPGGDLSQIVITEGGSSGKETLTGVAGVKAGTLQGTLSLNTTQAGTYSFQFSVTTTQGTASNTLGATFTVSPAPAAPVILSGLNPSSAVTGGPAFALTVTGTGFDSTSVVLWNGIPLSTSVLSATSLSAQVPAADLAAAGTFQISVLSDGTPSSSSLPLVVGNGSASAIAIPINDLVWDPARNVLYASIPSSAGTNGNSIAVVDPASGTITSTVFAGSEPGCLALSGDGSYLYAAINGRAAIQRFTLPGLAADILIPLGTSQYDGPNTAHDIEVMPGAPHTIAVSLANLGFSPSFGGMAIFDDATPRANAIPGWIGGDYLLDSLQWSPDGAALYAANAEDTAFDYYILAVDASGAKVTKDITEAFTNFNDTIRLDPGNHLLYAGTGQVLDPATGQQQGVFGTSGPMTTDSGLGLAYFFDSASDYSGQLILRSYDLTHFTPLGSLTVNAVYLTPGSLPTPPRRVIRWGTQGLAVGGGGSCLYPVSGPFVQGH